MANSNKDKVKMTEEEFLAKLLQGIDATESTEWDNETQNVSVNIGQALRNQLKSMPDNACNKKFLDYCNSIKSLLAVYNFGKLPTEKDLRAEDAPDSDIAKCRKITDDDKKLIIDGVKRIIEHVQGIGFDITPYLDDKECMQIFGTTDKDDSDKTTIIPITMSAATVMTTLVYFRRACKRLGLFSESELEANSELIDLIVNDQTFRLARRKKKKNDDGTELTEEEQAKLSTEFTAEELDKLAPEKKTALTERVHDLSDCVAFVIAKILFLFAVFVDNGDADKKYSGWGFTLDTKRSQAITLSDTYSVVDAISRFDDAFNQDDETKRDQAFLDKVGDFGECIGFSKLVKYSTEAISRTAFNLYDKSRQLYGKSLFYMNSGRGNAGVDYSYNPITFEQIASSNRSSALFNPLYVAMITMYGYNEKELVIRRFMDDYTLAKQYYDRYEALVVDGKEVDLPEGVTKTISEYSKELSWFKGKNFNEEVTSIITEHKKMSNAHGTAGVWRQYYDIARVFQKYLETQLGDELMKIEEYRDYLNATKDAIDQVQVAYRKFDDTQRLGIVDTDYMMFSAQDVGPDPVVISKLNKINLSVNYLRPLLLSSKIMIVRALTKYPQSDMGDLYGAIKESKHRKVISSGGRNRARADKDEEWLWNEDTVDMNSTARHCEAIMYDYFDYYEKYELSYKALSNIKKYYGKLLTPDRDDEEKTKQLASGDIEAVATAEGDVLSEFNRVVLNVTRQNVEKIKVIYNESLQEKDKEYQQLLSDKDALERKYEQRIEELKKAHELELQQLKVSIDIGNTVRGWIKAEADRNLREMLAYMILNNINGYQDKDAFNVEDMIGGKYNNEVIDGNFDGVTDIARAIMDKYKASATGAEQFYGDKIRDALNMQSLLEYALDDLLKHENVNKAAADRNVSLDQKNAGIHDIYGKFKAKRRKGIYNTADIDKKSDDNNNDDSDDDK